MPTRLILIRHGETDWSYQKRYCGFNGTPLNKKGRDQARQLSKRLKEENVHKVYSSDTKRALQFARIVFRDRHIEESSGFREINFGIFEGLRYKRIMDRYPVIYARWIDNPVDFTIPGGESLKDLAKRVRKRLAKILSQNKNKTAAIFTHAGPIKVILCDILKLDLRDIWQIEQDLAGMTIIEFVNGKGKVCLING